MMTKQTQEALNIAIELLQIQIGELVLQKMRSGNDIPVSRCTITNSEIDALFNDIKKEALEQPEFLDRCIAEIDAEIERNGGASLKQPAQEPVAWMDSEGRFRLDFRTEIVRSIAAINKEIPLYTHPAPSWQGLSDDEKLVRKWKDAYKILE